MDACEKARVLRLLPDEAPERVRMYAREHILTDKKELGGNLLLCRPVRMSAPPDMWELFENRMYSQKKKWMAECYCTSCGEISYTDKTKDGIVLFYGDDGYAYQNIEDDWIDEDEADMMGDGRTEVAWGEECLCPRCQETARVFNSVRIKDGRTKQVLLVSIERIDCYAAAVAWMVSRSIGPYGSSLHVYPAEAYVFGERGEVVNYSHLRGGSFQSTMDTKWRERSKLKMPDEIIYGDWGSISNRKCGYWMLPEPVSLIGTTGEKTGLYAYIQAGGEGPVEFMRLHRKYRNAEILALSGMIDLLEDILRTDDPARVYAANIDTKARKLPQMLGMTKPQLAAAVKDSTIGLSLLTYWRAYRNAKGSLEPAELFAIKDEKLGFLIRILERWGDDIPKVFRYLKKQNVESRQVGILHDTRDMLEQAYNRKLTPEEMWPRHLMQTHDRASSMLRDMQSDAKDAKLQAGFDRVCAMLAPTVYTDGRLMMTIPTCNADLVREGDILRHCVGGYGGTHSLGKNVILFVRHYRRPERPYYTLNISLSGEIPHRIQLHGYGNERHGERKQHIHTIPQEVKDFCDYWEKEILAPYWKAHKKEFIA